jgi:hypothetical protein
MTKFNHSKLASLLILFFALSTTLVSCKKDENNPKDVAEKFLTHLNNAEFGEAKKYADEATASMLGMLESFGGDKEKNEEKNTEKITIIKSEITEDKAVVTYKISSEEEEKTLPMKKIDGLWKVSIDKEGQNKEETPQMESEDYDFDEDELFDSSGNQSDDEVIEAAE